MKAAIFYRPYEPLQIESVTVDRPQDREVAGAHGRHGGVPQRPPLRRRRLALVGSASYVPDQST
jgi:hypothetical protein